MKVGLSIYFCILEVISGDVIESEVKAIIVGSLYQRNCENFLEAINYHSRNHDSQNGKMLIKLHEQGKLVHPCINGIVTPEWEDILSPFDAVDKLGRLQLKGLNEHWINI